MYTLCETATCENRHVRWRMFYEEDRSEVCTGQYFVLVNSPKRKHVQEDSAKRDPSRQASQKFYARFTTGCTSVRPGQMPWHNRCTAPYPPLVKCSCSWVRCLVPTTGDVYSGGNVRTYRCKHANMLEPCRAWDLSHDVLACWHVYGAVIGYAHDPDCNNAYL